MAKLILVRHGRTDWCTEKRVRGSMDIPLNANGTTEALRMANELSKIKIDAVYSSSASCSLSTADEIARQHKLKAKKVSELTELNLGLWQGLLLKDIKKRYKKQYNAWRLSPASMHPPGGESTTEAYDRTMRAMHELLDRHKEGNICLVSGSIALSMIKCHLKNIALEEVWKTIPEKPWWEALNV